MTKNNKNISIVDYCQ